MIEWTDRAVVLSVRAHGEGGAIVELLAQTQGRWTGLVRGGTGRRLRPVLQPGNTVQASWRARLADHLGSVSVEGDDLRAGLMLDDPAILDGLAAACDLCRQALPEREAAPEVFAGLEALLCAMPATPDWPALLVKWEVGLLGALGFPLDLSKCALTGEREDLTHVSPKTGRAVNGNAPGAAAFRDRLLALPPFLLASQAGATRADMREGLALTGHFLERWVLWPADRELSDARARLIARLEGMG